MNTCALWDGTLRARTPTVEEYLSIEWSYDMGFGSYISQSVQGQHMFAQVLRLLG